MNTSIAHRSILALLCVVPLGCSSSPAAAPAPAPAAAPAADPAGGPSPAASTSFDGRWQSEEVRLGRMTVEGKHGAAGRVDFVLLDVEGRRLEVSGSASKDDRRDERVECEATAGEQGLKVLFAKTADDEAPVGTMNFAFGDAVITFVRPHDGDGLVLTVHRASRPAATLRGIRMKRIADGAPAAAPAGSR